MDDKEKGRIAWFELGNALEDFGLYVVMLSGVYHLKHSNGDEFSRGTLLFYQAMNYFGIESTHGLLEASPEKRSIIILARKVDLFYS